MNWEGKCIMKNSLYHSHYSHFRAGMGQLLCGRNWFVGQDFQPIAPKHCGVPASWHLYHQLKHFIPMQMHLEILLYNVGIR